MSKGGAASPAPGQTRDKRGKFRNTHGEEPGRLLPGSAAAALIKVHARNTPATGKRRELRKLPSGRGPGFPERLLGVLHDGGETIHPGGCKEQDHRPKESVPQIDLGLLAGAQVRQTPQGGSGAHCAGGSTALAGTLVPPGDAPSLARGAPKDHDDLAGTCKGHPAGNTSAAGEVAQVRINGNIETHDPDRVGRLSDGLIQPKLEVTRPPLPREEMQDKVDTVIEEAVRGDNGGRRLPKVTRRRRGNVARVSLDGDAGQKTPGHPESRLGCGTIVLAGATQGLSI